jgi:hypothetical protein
VVKEFPERVYRSAQIGFLRIPEQNAHCQIQNAMAPSFREVGGRFHALDPFSPNRIHPGHVGGLQANCRLIQWANQDDLRAPSPSQLHGQENLRHGDDLQNES